MNTGKKRGLQIKFNSKDSANPSESQAENPFVEAVDQQFPGPGRVELEFPVTQGKKVTPERYLEVLQEGAKEFAWFHEFEFESSDDIRFALREKTVPAIRRVLLAFLGGGTRREAAARVPMSRSALYKVIRREIYFGGVIESWTNLGLIGGWDIPLIEVDAQFSDLFQDRSPEDVPHVCMLCHRIAGFIPMETRNFDFTIINETREILPYPLTEEEVIRGHLIAHFGLWDRPRANRSYPGLLYYLTSVSKNRRAAQRWDLVLDPIAITAAYDHRNTILPVVDGRTPTEMQMRRFYRNLLKGT